MVIIRHVWAALVLGSACSSQDLGARPEVGGGGEDAATSDGHVDGADAPSVTADGADVPVTGPHVADGLDGMSLVDEDFDGVDDAVDNCLGLFNPHQTDVDHDDIGDDCDTVIDDRDGDNVPD